MSIGDDRVLKIGARIIYFDSTRVAHEALVTMQSGAHEAMTVGEYKTKWNTSSPPCVNLVYVSNDVNRSDGYGRQIERQCSCTHGDAQSPRRSGNYWLWPDEV